MGPPPLAQGADLVSRIQKVHVVADTSHELFSQPAVLREVLEGLAFPRRLFIPKLEGFPGEENRCRRCCVHSSIVLLGRVHSRLEKALPHQAASRESSVCSDCRNHHQFHEARHRLLRAKPCIVPLRVKINDRPEGLSAHGERGLYEARPHLASELGRPLVGRSS